MRCAASRARRAEHDACSIAIQEEFMFAKLSVIVLLAGAGGACKREAHSDRGDPPASQMPAESDPGVQRDDQIDPPSTPDLGAAQRDPDQAGPLGGGGYNADAGLTGSGNVPMAGDAGVNDYGDAGAPNVNADAGAMSGSNLNPTVPNPSMPPNPPEPVTPQPNTNPANPMPPAPTPSPAPNPPSPTPPSPP
jgi:hypothetical protein